MLKAFLDRILSRSTSHQLEQFLADLIDTHCRLEGLPRTPGTFAGLTRYQSLQHRPPTSENADIAAWEELVAPIKERWPQAAAWSLHWICSAGERHARLQAKATQLGTHDFEVDPVPLLVAFVRLAPPQGAADVLSDWIMETFRKIAARQGRVPGDPEEVTACKTIPLLRHLDETDPAGPLGRGLAMVREILSRYPGVLQAGGNLLQSGPARLADAIVSAYDLQLVEAGRLSESELDTLLLEFPREIAKFGNRQFPEHAVWDNACRAAVDRLLGRMLAGDTDPRLSRALGGYWHFNGIDHFLAACRFMEMHPTEKLPLDQWGCSDDTLGWTARLLRVLPAPGPADQARAPELSAISPQTLQNATLLAPPWAPLAEAHVAWPAWARIVPWLARHGGIQPWNDGAPATQDDDEGGGAVDRETVQEAFAAMGEKRFNQLLKHRIARGLYRNGLFYAEAVLGRNAADVEAKFLKRDKLAVVALGMLPDEDDILQRYLALRKFAKESRQFGAQRQASEALAVDRALANLAVTAGYEDRVQLEWSMEARLVEELDPGRRWQIGEYTVWLEADEAATIRTERDGKQLKSVPPAVRQAEEYAEIKEAREQLQAQWDRVRRRLELAMVLGEEMDRESFAPALVTPAGQAMLPHLVLRY
ncbi:MAG TPA: DUF5724 domain-containing protein [Symbiobacteriaceae bacterium]|nr:DUF5724 domain-containing protein [Symbiobacteriaceae bacterium]